ncbi:hypothetical protein CK203_034489 [Vitis vinifera]|uniref:Uncharacterized protein n=1 Tax=Vitis vinifera TaxID=29760 RepID=A0A438HZL7_VITVI|nr:hypothetical protein CK203_034489 [Vitis vinifera]
MKEKSYVEVVNTREARERRLGEAVWIQLGEEDVGKGREFLDRCLVGSWGETEMTDADLRDMEKWGKHHWKLQGEMRIARIGGCCCLIVFEFKAEANNSREKQGSLGESDGITTASWNREVFKKIGDSCGGFIAVDESTGALKELQWARILVKVEGWRAKLSASEDGGKGRRRGKTRAGGAVEMVQAKGQPVKLAVPSEDGESSCIPALVTVSDMMQTRGVVAERQKDGGEYLQKEGTAIKKG